MELTLRMLKERLQYLAIGDRLRVVFLRGPA